MAISSSPSLHKPLPLSPHFLIDTACFSGYSDQILEQIEYSFSKHCSFDQRDANGVTIAEKVIRLSRSNSTSYKIWEIAVLKIFKTRNLLALEQLLEKRPIPRLSGIPFYAFAIATNWTGGFYALFRYRFNRCVPIITTPELTRLFGILSVTAPPEGQEGTLLSLCGVGTDSLIVHLLLMSGVNSNSRIFGMNNQPLFQLYANQEHKKKLLLLIHYGAEIDIATLSEDLKTPVDEYQRQYKAAKTVPNSERKKDKESLALIDGRILTPLSHSVHFNDYSAFKKLMSVHVSVATTPPLLSHWTPKTYTKLTHLLLEADTTPHVLMLNVESYYPTPYVSYGIALECELELIEPLAMKLCQYPAPVGDLSLQQLLDPLNHPLAALRITQFIAHLESGTIDITTINRIENFTRLLEGKSEKHAKLIDLLKKGADTESVDAED